MKEAENILQELPCGCVIFNQSGTISFVNLTLCSLLGYQSEEILGQNLEKVLTISSRIFHQTHFFPLLKLKGEVGEIFLTLKPKSGSAVPVMANAKSMIEDGQSFYVCVFVPVWERQKYEEQLLEINRAQQQALTENALLKQVTSELESNQFELDRKITMLVQRGQEYMQMGKVFMHDMQEPIRKISIFFDTFLRGANIEKNGDDLRHVEIIKKSIERLKFLTGSLLDFVQIGNGNDPVILIKPAELIQQARAELMSGNNEFELDVKIGDLPEFEGKAIQIKRVFFELLKNAGENRDINRKLSVEITAVVTEENAFQHNSSKYKYIDHVKIEFSDNGTGFDGRFNGYVFGLLNKINMDSKGPGLGLALCKQIISHHYGTIKSKSALGQGTTIVIVLPLRQKPDN